MVEIMSKLATTKLQFQNRPGKKNHFLQQSKLKVGFEIRIFNVFLGHLPISNPYWKPPKLERNVNRLLKTFSQKIRQNPKNLRKRIRFRKVLKTQSVLQANFRRKWGEKKWRKCSTMMKHSLITPSIFIVKRHQKSLLLKIIENDRKNPFQVFKNWTYWHYKVYAFIPLNLSSVFNAIKLRFIKSPWGTKTENGNLAFKWPAQG